MAEASKSSLSNSTERIDQIAKPLCAADSLAADADLSAGDNTPFIPKQRYLQCPHCLSRQLVLTNKSQAEIRCTSCGSPLDWSAEETIDAPPPTKSMAVVSGQRMGRFELIERLGSGGFGDVWKAKDTKLDRTVAVKIPHQGRLSPEEIEKFLREARAAAQLRHPGIVSVHEVGLEDDRLYIVEDFIEGLSLDKWLEGRRVDYRQAAELCVKIAGALHNAHQEGVIHRDLKPGNIMIDVCGEPHIMDFGLAKREAGETTMTMDGQILGTPAYMSPEQAKGLAHTADCRSDVYSLGVILFELLTGERPFRGSLQMLLKQVLQDDPPNPRKLDSRVPRDLETICLKCLHKEPPRRYPTAQALSDELKRYLAGMPIQARPVTALERVGRWCRRNPLVAGSALVAAVCLLFGLFAATLGYIRTSQALEKSQLSLSQARQAVDDLFTRVSEDTLLKEPGMQRLRKDLLQRARDYYEKFLVQSGGDQAVRDELALDHYRVGLITEEIDSPASAMPSYENARKMQTQLLHSDPENIKRLESLGDTYNALGRALHKQQQLDRSLEAYGKAIELRNRLAALDPQISESRRTLANTYMNVGLVEMDLGSSSRARQYLERTGDPRTIADDRGRPRNPPRSGHGIL